MWKLRPQPRGLVEHKEPEPHESPGQRGQGLELSPQWSGVGWGGDTPYDGRDRPELFQGFIDQTMSLGLDFNPTSIFLPVYSFRETEPNSLVNQTFKYPPNKISFDGQTLVSR